MLTSFAFDSRDAAAVLNLLDMVRFGWRAGVAIPGGASIRNRQCRLDRMFFEIFSPPRNGFPLDSVHYILYASLH